MSDCVFCDIVAGTGPAEILQEWDDAIALVPLDPVTPGHTLIIPRQHVADALTDAEVTAQMMYRAVEYARTHPSMNILTSVGGPATQSIFHLHVHVVPRVENDQLMLPWGTTGDPHLPHHCKGMDEAVFVRKVLRIFAKADAREDLFYTYVEESELKMFALVSDVFEWGTADVELITPETLPELEQAAADLRAINEDWWVAELYAARRRKMRPQGAYYHKTLPEALWPLFDAAGPERGTDLFNPKAHP